MPDKVSASILAISLFIATFAVNLHVPLYGIYAANSGMGTTAVTIAFAAYVAGLMPTLLFLGGVSDSLGRRLPISVALILGVAATALLVLKSDWAALVIARVLLGVGTGLATPAGTAYMVELMGISKEDKAALTVTSATSLGFAGGSLATGISLGLQGPTLLPSSYIILFVAAPVLAILCLILPRVDIKKNTSWIRLPFFPKRTWVFGMAMMVAWATTGMIIAIIPLELQKINLGGWSGLVVFLGIFTGFLCQPIARSLKNLYSLLIGIILTPLGFIFILLGMYNHSIISIIAGTCITSLSSYGFTYLSSLSEVSAAAPANRARAIAGLFIYAYIGFSIPVMLSGFVADVYSLIVSAVSFFLFQILVTIFILVSWLRHFKTL